MSKNIFLITVKKDLLKYRRKSDLKSFIYALIVNQGFKIVFIFRLCNLFYDCKIRILYIFLTLVRRLYSTRYSLWISPDANIGGGLRISHCFSIIINSAEIGDNFTVLQQTTIGSNNGGNRSGCCKIGDNVFMGAGAKIIGNVNIESNVVIGANAVITKNIISGVTVAGVPAKIINYKGEEYSQLWCANN